MVPYPRLQPRRRNLGRPSITLRNRTLAAYLPFIAVMAYAIARYWKGNLL